MVQEFSQETSLLEGEHEEILLLSDPVTGLRAVIALHDLSHGVALGGIRCLAYDSEELAIRDALRLSRAMTLKTVVAGIPAGGGKAVVMDHAGMDRAAAFRELGERIEDLGGRFFTSADLGTGPDDLRQVASRTRHVTDPDDPNQPDLVEQTAEGVFLAAGTCLDVLGIAEWNGLTIAIQGLGKIGLSLATKAARAGARVIACDMDQKKVEAAVDTLGLRIVAPNEIYDASCDVFAPCAMGGVLSRDTIPRLRCRLIVGAANDQLEDRAAGDLIAQRGILYAPDYVVNCGAVRIGCRPRLPHYDPPRSLEGISALVRRILLESLEQGLPPHRVADALAERLWRERRERREEGEGRSQSA